MIRTVDEFHTFFRTSHQKSLNSGELLLLARNFQRSESDYYRVYEDELTRIKIAILGSYTSHHLVSLLRLYLYQHNLAPQFLEGEYDSIATTLLDPSSDIYPFQPQILILLSDLKDIKDYPPIFATNMEVVAWRDKWIQHYVTLWSKAEKIPNCQIFQTTFVTPLHRPLGNLEANYVFSPTSCITQLSLELLMQKPDSVTFIDMNYIASSFGKNIWFDEKNYYLTKQGFSISAYPIVSDIFATIIANSIKIERKCLVLDLDNTLWGGVIADDGIEGINLNSSHPIGEAFLAFQYYLKQLKERGIILTVCSKNDEDSAKKNPLKIIPI